MTRRQNSRADLDCFALWKGAQFRHENNDRALQPVWLVTEGRLRDGRSVALRFCLGRYRQQKRGRNGEATTGESKKGLPHYEFDLGDSAAD